jgi:predicted permease
MSFLHNLAAGLRSLFRKEQIYRELDEEMDEFLEMAIEEKMKEGISRTDAIRAVRLERGTTEVAKEMVYAAGWESLVETLSQDLRFGIRILRKSPGFSVVAVLTLALGIGANTAIFSFIDAVLLRMLPVRSPEQLVRLTTERPDGKMNDSFSYPTFRLLQENQALSGVLAFREMGHLNLLVNGEPGLAKGQVVSGSYYSVLGIRPILGRLITQEDDGVVGGSPVAVISDSYWAKRFNRQPSVVGAKITLNGSPFTIIGVTPPEFFGLQPGESVDVSVPLKMIPALDPPFAAAPPYFVFTAPFRNWLFLVARLKPEATEKTTLANLAPTFAEAQREVARSLTGLPFDSPETHKLIEATRLRFEPGSQGLAALRKQFSKPLLVLVVIVALLLLIACANVANLLLARANSRQKEVALRLALGAERLRVVRQMFTESMLLAMAGGALGVLLAFWGCTLLLELLSSSSSPVLLTVTPNIRVLGFTFLVSILAAIVFGLAPAWWSPQIELTQKLREAGQNVGTSQQRSKLGDVLAVGQIALSLMMLVGASLLLLTLRNLRDLDPGFNRENVLLISLDPGMVGYSAPQVSQLYGRMLERIRALPGVRTVSFSMFSPLSPRFTFTVPTIEGHVSRTGGEDTPVSLNFVGPTFFSTMGTRIIQGREFTDSDQPSAPKTAIINQAMAHLFFGDESPLGRRFSIPGWIGDKSMLEIVGVVENTKYLNLREPTPPMAYIPFFQSPDTHPLTFEVRALSHHPESLILSLREVVNEADKRLPIFDIKTLDQQVDESVLQERLVASLSTAFGVVALLMTSVGLYGLISYSVGRRTHEIGLRMALGAGRGQVSRLILFEGFRLTFLGIVIGIVGALAITRFLSSLLFGIKPTDPFTFVIVSLILSAVTFLATYIPALRAMRVNPVVALRYE